MTVPLHKAWCLIKVQFNLLKWQVRKTIKQKYVKLLWKSNKVVFGSFIKHWLSDMKGTQKENAFYLIRHSSCPWCLLHLINNQQKAFIWFHLLWQWLEEFFTVILSYWLVTLGYIPTCCLHFLTILVGMHGHFLYDVYCWWRLHN